MMKSRTDCFLPSAGLPGCLSIYLATADGGVDFPFAHQLLPVSRSHELNGISRAMIETSGLSNLAIQGLTPQAADNDAVLLFEALDH